MVNTQQPFPFGRGRWRWACAILALCILHTATAVAAPTDIHRCPQADGSVRYQSQPCHSPENATALPPAQSLANATSECSQMAAAIRAIGSQLQTGQSATAIRSTLQTTFSAEQVQAAFSAYEVAGGVPSEELAVAKQLACETQQALPAMKDWQRNQTEFTLRLQNWQQRIVWPASWRVTGTQEPPAAQLELRYADNDAAVLRLGCRAHNSQNRWDGVGMKVLALWAEQLQPGINKKYQNTRLGNHHGKDPGSRRELLSASFQADEASGSANFLGSETANRYEIWVSLAPQRLCFVVRSGHLREATMSQQTRRLATDLLLGPELDMRK